MIYNLFLDDFRSPKDVTWVELPPVEWCVVRTYKDFVELIQKKGVPKTVSFDHDLADTHYIEEQISRLTGQGIRYNTLKEQTGYHAAQWLAEYCVDNGVPIPEYYIHTMNGEGAKNIKSVLESARDFMIDGNK